MLDLIPYLLGQLNATSPKKTKIIPWSSPVPSFGDITGSKIATVGINPSNKEFVDDLNNELSGSSRRFHTLQSLGLRTWAEAEQEHHRKIASTCQGYFQSNPYDRWFRQLDFLISGTGFSYYSPMFSACHLDLIPFATSCKWAELTTEHRQNLLAASGDTLGRLVRESPIQVLILNGSSVVSRFHSVCDTALTPVRKKEWTLPRSGDDGDGVAGYAYEGCIKTLAGVQLKREVTVLGFNHNIQGSFGVTKEVKTSIRNWLSSKVSEVLS